MVTQRIAPTQEWRECDDPTAWPDHTQLPETDGSFVKNFQEHPQSVLLTTSIEPLLRQIHSQWDYCIGQDSGIYWRLTDPPEQGAVSPDWFYVPGVNPLPPGEYRRSYVLWQEQAIPLIVIEFVSGDGREERDRTPYHGKFWVYEQAIGIPYYAIYEGRAGRVTLYRLGEDRRYANVEANERGHYPIASPGVELGIWYGRYQESIMPWLRWWDAAGNLLLTGEERAERFAKKLREMGVDPDTLV
jgi:Uma2 family endonuclease